MYMYNRYTPQPDGTYRRKTVPVPQHREVAPPVIGDPPAPVISIPDDPPRSKAPARQRPPMHRPEVSAGSFLRDLLPRDLDTGDLLIIILLLLMASDSSDDQGNALFTLALYLFM